MADSVGEGSNGAVGTSQGNGAQLSASLGHSLPGHSTSGANPASPPPAAAAETGLAAVSPAIAHNITSVMGSVGVLSHAVSSNISAPAAVPPSLPPSIGLGVTGAPPSLAGAGLLSQIHATSWDPTLSTDWDNEKASQQCILRIKR